MAKVTMQDIADALGVSRVSVWKVFHNQPGVSDSLKNSIWDMATKLGYNGITPLAPENVKKQYKTISLVVSQPDSSFFLTDVIHSIAKELSLHNVNLMYTYMPEDYNDQFQLPDVLTGIGGIIVLNTYNPQIIKRITKLKTPKVFLDTVPLIPESILNCDLVLVEGWLATSEIVSAAVKRDCKNFGFIGDIHYSRTNLERYNGFKCGLSQNNIKLNSSICFTKSVEFANYKACLFEFLDSIETMPDVFICVNDHVAQLVHTYISTYPERFSKSVMVTGFDGNNDCYENVATAIVSAKKLGRKLAMQILYRMDYPNSPKETVYLHPEISIR